MLSMSMGWAYDPADINVSYFMTASTGTSDDMGKPDSNAEYNGVSPLQALKEVYNILPDSLAKVRGRCVNAEHGDMQLRTDMAIWPPGCFGSFRAMKMLLRSSSEMMPRSWPMLCGRILKRADNRWLWKWNPPYINFQVCARGIFSHYLLLQELFQRLPLQFPAHWCSAQCSWPQSPSWWWPWWSHLASGSYSRVPSARDLAAASADPWTPA